jgi:hypothetical protein
LAGEGLAHPGDDDEAWAANSDSSAFTLKETEEPEVLSVFPVGPCLIEAVYRVMHRFPPATATKTRRRAVRDRGNDCNQLRTD